MSNNVRNFITGITAQERRNLRSKFENRYNGDLGSAVSIMQRDPEMDQWFRQARSNDEFYDKLDEVHKALVDYS